jgi:hypothetical protein
MFEKEKRKFGHALGPIKQRNKNEDTQLNQTRKNGVVARSQDH